MQTTQEFERAPLPYMYAMNHPYLAESVQDARFQMGRSVEPPNNYHVYVEHITLNELVQKFPEESRYRVHLEAIVAQKGPACAGIPELDIHRWAEIVIWLPDLDDHELEEFALQIPDVGNYLSADYMRSSTMLVWRSSNGREVRVNTFTFYQAQALNPNDLGFGVAFLNRTSVRYATHHLSTDALYSLVCSLQVAEASSGCNYRPYRLWENELLEAHKGLSESSMTGIHVPELIDTQKCLAEFPC